MESLVGLTVAAYPSSFLPFATFVIHVFTIRISLLFYSCVILLVRPLSRTRVAVFDYSRRSLVFSDSVCFLAFRAEKPLLAQSFEFRFERAGSRYLGHKVS